uniref:uncharacterized protein LOC100179570 n=1 Tax=Ciona intestinalis TaxID=7719 RepID=UPI0000522DFA|nr:uncharacterized protein LOC100179570 [Ciona intestinalis]|eukprot:XP_002120605.1 uncharacterized protein LOC100179570 [Ciona intestinalis]
METLQFIVIFAYSCIFLYPVQGQSQSSCELPFVWNAATGDNWLLPGIIPGYRAKFELVVEGLDSNNRYIPGRAHKVSVKVRSKTEGRMRGFYLLLDPVEEQTSDCMCSFNVSCGLGRFVKKSNKKNARLGTKMLANCTQMIYADNKVNKKRWTMKWVAPTCGGVVIRATIRGKDGKIYFDNDDLEPQFQVLSRILYPSTDSAPEES